jgi:putative transposase
MDALMHNELIQVLASAGVPHELVGLFRVILDDPRHDTTVLARVDDQTPHARWRGGRPKAETTKRPRKKPKAALVGALVWPDRKLLSELHYRKLLVAATVGREGVYARAAAISGLSGGDGGSGGDSACTLLRWTRRRQAMAGFLEVEHLQESILVHRGLSGLVREAVAAAGVCRSFVYEQWSTLCRLGISELSLLPRHDRCGAPGQRRNVDGSPGKPARKKAGRKTLGERIDQWTSRSTADPAQPGMSSAWRARILAGDSALGTPKPPMEVRYRAILATHFTTDWKQEGSKLTPVLPPQGRYPNLGQVRRVLTTTLSRLQRLAQSTTRGHFERSLRGARGRNWEGVCGPGHTWAIDSTIGDIYLRSGICRAWILGRPIVYVIVDVWSTAVVGFYVCLAGPSWDTARIAVFNALAEPALLGELWGYQPLLHLDPLPTAPYALMCDRGEYLSYAASDTLLRLVPCASYAPPYRPDLKGLVEVLHRIQKDALFHAFIPGAIDARRVEYELRRSDPTGSAMTLREFVQYLHVLFATYNLCADRSHRLDAQMIAAGVVPCPAGLWRFGHEVGIGLRRYIAPDELIGRLLPAAEATVVNGGARFDGALYRTDVQGAHGWSADALNFGRWKVPIHYYPGSISRVWTPHLAGDGLMCLPLSDESQSPEATREEYLDAVAVGHLAQPAHDHAILQERVAGDAMLAAITAQAQRLTALADAQLIGKRPAMEDVRAAEIAVTVGRRAPLESRPAGPTSPCSLQGHDLRRHNEEATDSYLQMMKAIGAVADRQAPGHE